MKEIIGAVIFVVALVFGTTAFKGLHDKVRLEALKKSSQGLPSLVGFTQSIRSKKTTAKQKEQKAKR